MSQTSACSSSTFRTRWGGGWTCSRCAAPRASRNSRSGTRCRCEPGSGKAALQPLSPRPGERSLIPVTPLDAVGEPAAVPPPPSAAATVTRAMRLLVLVWGRQVETLQASPLLRTLAAGSPAVEITLACAPAAAQVARALAGTDEVITLRGLDPAASPFRW